MVRIDWLRAPAGLAQRVAWQRPDRERELDLMGRVIMSREFAEFRVPSQCIVRDPHCLSLLSISQNHNTHLYATFPHCNLLFILVRRFKRALILLFFLGCPFSLRLSEAQNEFSQLVGGKAFLIRNEVDAQTKPSIENPPGYCVSFNVDPLFLRLGEDERFLQFLLTSSVHLEIWSAESMMLIGTTSVALKVGIMPPF
ncbi:unnamed protein product [Dibothriocephalus latus]|uniref:NPHP4 C2-like domain-containing protein n=1 Tax=Dibothriocephalus latus TaxID=60516 RepID=A0A3P6TQL8_DIBLA|nr:unnamed protein product [Dibothriocephalus latus]